MYTKTQTIPKNSNFAKKLKETLTEFNRALVYGFDTEASPQEVNGSPLIEHTLFFSTAQYQDMLDAYIYAQDVILPAFKAGPDNLTASQLESYLKNLHNHIGNSLLKGFQSRAGVYCDQQIYRWQASYEVDFNISFTLANYQPSHLNMAPIVALKAELLNKSQISGSEVDTFLALLKKLSQDPNIVITESQKASMSNHEIGMPGEIAKAKLTNAYFSGLLSTEEKILTEKIVKFGTPPDKIPEAMHNFAKNVIELWENLDTTDLRAVSKFLAHCFFHLTEIHPFGNANGRTATALINIFLRTFNLNSIFLRYPEERNDSNSSYRKAIDQIDKTQEPLIEHIYQRILENQENPFIDEELEQIIILRIEMSDKLKYIKHIYKIDIDLYRNKINEWADIAAQDLKENENPSLKALLLINKQLDNSIIFLQQQSQANNHQSFVSTQNNVTLIPEAKAALIKLTETDGWNMTAKLEAWLECNTREEGQAIVKQLQEAKICQNVSLMNRKDNHVPVVKISGLDICKLRQLAMEKTSDCITRTSLYK